MPELSDILKSDYEILKSQPDLGATIKSSAAPLTGIALTDAWSKLALNTTDFNITALGGFTFDNALNRFIWDNDGAIGIDITPDFWGDAGVSSDTANVTITLGIFIDGVLFLETPINFLAVSKIQSYGANSHIADKITGAAILTQGSYIEFFAKAATGETPTASMNYFNIIVKGR